MSKRKGMCFDCMKDANSIIKIPEALRRFSCEEIIFNLKNDVFVRFSVKRVPSKHRWNIEK